MMSSAMSDAQFMPNILAICFMISLLVKRNSAFLSYRSYFATQYFSKSANMATVTTALHDATSTVVINANIVQQRVEDIINNCNRAPNSVRLVAVSKTKPAESIQELYDAGFRNFGENYFQELVEKAQILPKDIKWHFIGHLQSSKASKLIREVPNLAVVETIDSVKLAGKLNTACETADRDPLQVFLQVDTSGEDTKSGVKDGPELDELLIFVKEKCPYLRIAGLMTIGAPNDFTCFDKLATCRMRAADVLSVSAEQLELSMGMSGDFEEAIRRGATSVRVGSTIFGPRLYSTKPSESTTSAATTST